MWKRMILMLVLVAVFVGALGFYKYQQIRAKIAEAEAMVMPATAVTSYTVKAQTWQPVLGVIGSLKALNGVEVSTDLAGIITEIAFESGQKVKKGDLLLRLDTKQEVAKLRSAEAGAELAKVNLARQEDLLRKRATSQSEHDTAAANYDQAVSAVEEVRALIDRKTIHAPFDGILGIRKIDLGQYLDVGRPIVSLESLDPIRVEFAVPQQDLRHVAVGKSVRIKAAGLDGKPFEGQISALDAKIDAATRNITVEAVVPNREGHLRAGMFVTVEVLLPEEEGVVAIPSSSIAYAPYGDSIFLIRKAEQGEGLQAVQHFIKTGETQGDLVVIREGVKVGDVIVSSGVFKLNNGAPIEVNDKVQPSAKLHPQPPET